MKRGGNFFPFLWGGQKEGAIDFLFIFSEGKSMLAAMV